MAKNKLVGTPNPPPSQQSPGPQFIGRDPCEYSPTIIRVYPAFVPRRFSLNPRCCSRWRSPDRRSVPTRFRGCSAAAAAFYAIPPQFQRLAFLQLSPFFPESPSDRLDCSVAKPCEGYGAHQVCTALNSKTGVWLNIFQGS